MGMTLVEKILAKHSCKTSVVPDEFLTVKVDVCMANDATMRLNIDVVQNVLKAEKVWDPSKIVLIMDHQVPADSPQTAIVHSLSKKFAEKYGIKAFYNGEGICHQLLVEKYVLPGQLMVGADSHSPSMGALGAVGLGMGSTDIGATMVTGKTWVKVPHSVKVVLKGEMQAGVYPKDIILALIKKTGAGGLVYKAVEFEGDAVKKLSVSERFTLCNMATEAGVKTAIIAPDEQVYKYLKDERGISIPIEEWIIADKDAHYQKIIEMDIDSLEPQVACPHSVDNVCSVREIAGKKIDQAFVGACTNSRIDDLRIVAEVVKGKKVHPDVKFDITPSSRKVYMQAIKEGLISIFLEAGARINHPGCSTCWGACQGVLGPGEVLIGTQNRNFKGRAGSKDAMIYLASPKTVAVSAIKGVISDPREDIQ